MLFTYNPFDGLHDYPAPGPIFIHEEECERFDGDSFPPELRSLPLMFEAYGENRHLIEREPANGEGVERVIARLLGLPGVRYIHLRNAEAGCFMANITRGA
jgi:hypothetical protein